MTAFPPRLPEQPIFYPVLIREYAEQIARDWNAKTPPFAGYVTEFELDDAFAAQFEQRVVGGGQHAEFWVPAEQLDDFNHHIQGSVRGISAFFANGFRGHIPEHFGLAGHTADEQIRILAASWSSSSMDFSLETRANETAIYLSFPYWTASDPTLLGLSSAELRAAVDGIRRVWDMGDRIAPLIEQSRRDA